MRLNSVTCRVLSGSSRREAGVDMRGNGLEVKEVKWGKRT